MSSGAIVGLVLFCAVGGGLIGVFFYLKGKLREFSKAAFGTESFIEGYKRQADVLAEQHGADRHDHDVERRDERRFARRRARHADLLQERPDEHEGASAETGFPARLVRPRSFRPRALTAERHPYHQCR